MAARTKKAAQEPAMRTSDQPSTRPNVRGAAHATDLDRLIHGKVRLGIVSALAATDSMSFVDLKQALDLTDGNLSVHARKLEEAGYVSCRKTFKRRKPLTEYQLTAKGRNALERYLDHMDAVLAAARGVDR